MMTRQFYILTVLLMVSAFAKAQSNKINRAEKYYNEYAFQKAQEAYVLAQDEKVSDTIYAKLADSYYNTAQYKKAAIYFEKWFGIAENKTPDFLYKYAVSLKSSGDYKRSNEVYSVWESLNKKKSNDIAYLKKIEQNSERYTIVNEDFNTPLSEFSTAYYGDKIVFASNKQRRRFNNNIHTWDNNPLFELYEVPVNERKANRVKKVNAKFNTRYHESTAVFSMDGNTVYFTRNNYTNNNFEVDSTGTNRLKLYRGTRQDNEDWMVEELPFNSNEYSVAHPSLNADESRLYFASDMPGGFGYSDIYYVEITEDGFTNPINLGDSINTEGRDTFPYISADGRLYFASDSHLGLGGLDIFVTEIDDDNFKNSIENVGRPVNSPEDDFGLIIDTKTSTGFFTSNRPGGKGNDDIYSFTELKPLVFDCNQLLKGAVLNVDTNKGIEGATVVLFDKNGAIINTLVSSNNGVFDFSTIDCSTVYSIEASKEKFEKAKPKMVMATKTNNEVIEVDIPLTPIPKLEPIVALGTDLAKLLNLNPIYFDLDKSYIRSDAEIELQKVIDYMAQYPTVKVEVRSHTDSRGSDKYNFNLSDRRAKSTADYIIKKGGINRSRISGQGFGETELQNGCSNGVKCSKAQHQLNRRSEFIVVSN